MRIASNPHINNHRTGNTLIDIERNRRKTLESTGKVLEMECGYTPFQGHSHTPFQGPHSIIQGQNHVLEMECGYVLEMECDFVLE